MSVGQLCDAMLSEMGFSSEKPGEVTLIYLREE